MINGAHATHLLREWGETKQARRMADAAREFREDLRKAVMTWIAGRALPAAFVNRLNGFLQEHPMRTKLQSRGKDSSTELWFEPQRPEDLLAPLVHAAAMLFATADRERVRKCSHCVLLFLDISKKGTRRWCSMDLCGNRAKVAAYAARQRG